MRDANCQFRTSAIPKAVCCGADARVGQRIGWVRRGLGLRSHELRTPRRTGTCTQALYMCNRLPVLENRRSSCWVERPRPLGRHRTLQMMRSEIPIDRVSMLQELGRCKRSHRERCGATHSPGDIASRAGCWLRSAARSEAPVPFRDNSGSHRLHAAWVVNHKSEGACFAAFGSDGRSQVRMDAASHHTTPGCARSTPLACNRSIP